MPQILAVNLAGAPTRWISAEEAVTCYVLDKVAAELGEKHLTFHGGINRLGLRSEIGLSSIVMLHGPVVAPSDHIALSNRTLFARDRNLCGYCGLVFTAAQLTRDHIQPVSRGGRDVWENVVTACFSCNHDRKRNLTPEEAGMPLLYAPYRPSRNEHFILTGRSVLADQMEYLLAGVPKDSRLLV